jgi:hypothetical protein
VPANTTRSLSPLGCGDRHGRTDIIDEFGFVEEGQAPGHPGATRVNLQSLATAPFRIA